MNSKIEIMKFKISFIFLFVTILCFANDKEVFWGQTGHRVVGEIAYKHLTKRAKKNLKKSKK